MKTKTPQTESVQAIVQPPLLRQSSEADELIERMIAYRKERFAVEVGPSRWGRDGEINVSITSNGDQWHCISLMPDEIEQVIAALNSFLSNV